MEKKITLKKIKEYIEGNTQMMLDQMGIKPNWYKEQIAYRMLKCKDDCMIEKKCIYCDCDVPGKLYVNVSCNNGERFPNIMDEENWNEYKLKNGIK